MDRRNYKTENKTTVKSRGGPSVCKENNRVGTEEESL